MRVDVDPTLYCVTGILLNSWGCFDGHTRNALFLFVNLTVWGSEEGHSWKVQGSSNSCQVSNHTCPRVSTRETAMSHCNSASGKYLHIEHPWPVGDGCSCAPLYPP